MRPVLLVSLRPGIHILPYAIGNACKLVVPHRTSLFAICSFCSLHVISCAVASNDTGDSRGVDGAATRPRQALRLCMSRLVLSSSFDEVKLCEVLRDRDPISMTHARPRRRYYAFYPYERDKSE